MIVGFIAIELLLFVANFRPGTFLMGWDNLMPELHIWEAIKRGIFGVWLSYRGLGLVDGQSHAASIVHTLVAGLLSVALPQTLIRYTITFGLHAAGMIGIYYLVKKILGHNRSNTTSAIIAGLFYGLNPATIQMFYTPFEPFTIHFAALPWIAWSIVKYFHEPHTNVKPLLWILLLSTSQFFVPTLLVPTIVLIASFSLMHMRSWRHILRLGAGFLLINAFWLLPYLYSLPANAPVIQNAKINQMSTSDIYERDRAFGTASDVLLLKGFPLDFEDYDTNGAPALLMGAWKQYFAHPSITMISAVFAVIAIAGVLIALTSHIGIPIAISGITAGVFLATDAPVAGQINMWIRQAIPVLAEGLRVPFTKFIFLFVLSYSVWIALAVDQLLEHAGKMVKIFLSAAVGIAIVILAYPAFGGQFIAPIMRVALPDDYAHAFAFFQKQPADNRIALLPQPAYWSWKIYQYGYHGSGFMWFGLPQALLDRAFDPWSHTNENYYWELSRALYAKDARALQAVFQKYNIRYAVLDDYLVSASNNRSLFSDETRELFTAMPTMHLVQTFGRIAIYERTDATLSDISLWTNLPTVNSYHWTDNDIAFNTIGNYIVSQHATPDYTYSFRSLFTKRSANEREFAIQDQKETLDITSTYTASVSALPKHKTVAYDSAKTADLDPTHVTPCGLLKQGVAGATAQGGILRLTSTNQRGCLSFDIPTLPHKDGYLIAVKSTHITGRPLMISFINDTAKHTELETYAPLDTQEKTTYFILPPLAADGLGYTVYISNDAIGKYPTVNELGNITVYTLPYDELVNLRFTNTTVPPSQPVSDIIVSHPNPAYYNAHLPTNRHEPSTLILSQSFDPGWIAFTIRPQAPFVTMVPDHVLVNNWENGWTIYPDTNSTIYIIFWPQLLQFIGFVLLPIPLVIFQKKN